MEELFKYLRNLKLNNNREWFYAHKQEYDKLRGNFENDISKLLALMSMYDDELKNLTPKDCIYRIYRDIRFSEDKTPYKTHFGVFMTKYGRKLNRAGYYLHIEPGGSMLCAGLWFPDPALLKAVRKEICDNAEELLEIMANPALKKTYGGFDRENTLKKVPNGYPKDFPYPELLKLKSFGVVYKAKDDFFYDRKWIEKVAEYFRPAKAMNDFFNYTADEMYNR